MKIKLVHFTTDPNVGGGPKHIYHLAKNLDSQLFDSIVISPNGWLPRELNSQSASRRTNTKYFEYKTTNSILSEVWELRKIFKKIKALDHPFSPIILHVHSPRSLYIASKAIIGLGVYLIYTEHIWTADYHTQSWWRDLLQIAGIRQSLRSASKVIAVSKSVANFLSSKKIIKKDKIEVIYPVLDQLVSHKKDTKKIGKGPLTERIIIGSVGAINYIKGYEYLVEAAKILKDRDIEFKIEIIGDGPQLDSIKQSIKDKNLSSVIKIVSKVASENLDDYYRKWDIYVQPSLSETFGLSVLAALEHGLPVVACRVGGLTEIIENNHNGLLVPTKNPERLAEALGELITNKKLYQKLASKAGETVDDNRFNGQDNLRKIEEIYKKLI